ncbi:hypothetical protein DFH09DRAFT_1079496 [Mycena vulgaris]|nr:hypothetical protein DFH09DRAFT_1079496 [Mycena vulgaris]
MNVRSTIPKDKSEARNIILNLGILLLRLDKWYMNGSARDYKQKIWFYLVAAWRRGGCERILNHGAGTMSIPAISSVVRRYGNGEIQPPCGLGGRRSRNAHGAIGHGKPKRGRTEFEGYIRTENWDLDRKTRYDMRPGTTRHLARAARSRSQRAHAGRVSGIAVTQICDRSVGLGDNYCSECPSASRNRRPSGSGDIYRSRSRTPSSLISGQESPREKEHTEEHAVNEACGDAKHARVTLDWSRL